MFYNTTFAPAIERDSVFRSAEKLFLKKNFRKYLEVNNKSIYLCIHVRLTNKISSLKTITYQQVVQER